MPPTIITSLDVGTTKVCAIIAEVDNDRQINVIGFGMSSTSGISKGIVTDIDLVAASIKKAISSAESMSGIEVDSVYLSIAGEHIACMNSRNILSPQKLGTQINETDINRLNESACNVVLPPDREIINKIPRGYIIDGQPSISNPVGMYANTLELETHIITGVSTFIHNMVKCVNQTQCSVIDIVYGPLATTDSVLYEVERNSGVALVDIGGGTTDIIVVCNNKIDYSASIPVGGNHVTADISIGLRTELNEAEKIKLEHGCISVDDSDKMQIFKVYSIGNDEPRILPKKILSEIIEPRISEICDLIRDKLESADLLQKLSSGVVLTGGTSALSGIDAQASKIFGLPVRIGLPCELPGIDDDYIKPSYSQVVGLTVYASKHCDFNYPAEDYKDIFDNIMVRIKKFFADIKFGFRKN